MPLFELPEQRPIPNFVEQANASFVREYHETVEEFLRSLGVSQETASEYKFRKKQGDSLGGEIWHGEKVVGVVSVRFDGDNLANGYRWVVECFKVQR